MSLELEHVTPTKKLLLHFKSNLCKSKDLYPFQSKEYFESLCRNGCPNFNKKWSCPPYSPDFITYSRNYDYCLVCILYCDLDQFDYTKTEYMKVKACNSILKSKMDKLMRYLENYYSGLIVSNGSCRICKPCNLKLNLSCKRPTLRRYSMESLGLDVNKVSTFMFNHSLKWYKDKKAPTYTSVVSCLLINNINNINIDSSINKYFYD